MCFDNWDFIAIIISVIALGFSLYEFFIERVRLRKESTLNAYLKIQTETIKMLKDLQNAGISFKDLDKNENKTEWDKVTLCLVEIENFAVGINTKIYDLDTLNRLGGGNIIEWYRNLKPVIQKKRGKNSNGKPYDEFETMVNSLEKHRG